MNVSTLVTLALLVMVSAGHSERLRDAQELLYLHQGASNLLENPSLHILVRTTHNDSGSGDKKQYDEANDNCTHPRNPPQIYKTSCDFVHAECANKAELFDYMAFIVCNLPSAQVSILQYVSGQYLLCWATSNPVIQPIGFVLMAFWAIYLISLLATTVSYFSLTIWSI